LCSSLRWLLLRWLWPRESELQELSELFRPPPQVIFHVHLIVPLKEQSPIRAGGDTRSGPVRQCG
jgi:hypothetical protein